jgi:hypothetical protein
MVLKVNMAMAAMEMPIAMNHFGMPGINISDFCGSALIMSRKSSRLLLMVARLTSVTVSVMYHIMILVYFTVGSTSSGSAFVIAPNLGTKTIFESISL